MNLVSVYLKSITDLHSQDAARNIINDNFKKIQGVIVEIQSIKLSDLTDLVLPTDPGITDLWALKWNGTKWTFVKMILPGLKYVIQEDEELNIPPDYQYTIFDHFFIFGNVTLEENAELIIL